jgi:hypothetical protein
MKRHAFEQIESEIRKEKAEALGRAGERLEQILLEIEAFRQEICCLAEKRLETSPGARGWHARDLKVRLAEHARLCEEAKRLRHSLIIQREAVGLWRHEDVERQYPEPRPLTLPPGTMSGETR